MNPSHHSCISNRKDRETFKSVRFQLRVENQFNLKCKVTNNQTSTYNTSENEVMKLPGPGSRDIADLETSAGCFHELCCERQEMWLPDDPSHQPKQIIYQTSKRIFKYLQNYSNYLKKTLCCETIPMI